MHRSAALLALLAVTALSAVQLVVYWPALPDRVVSHFDAHGNPDGATDKGTFTAIAGALAAGNALLFLGIVWLVGRLPHSLINMPHRQHWLAPERRAATKAWIGDHLLWFGAATQLFLLGLMQLTIRVNLQQQDRLGLSFWTVLLGYLGFTAWWLLRMYRRFPRPQEAA